MSSSVQSGTPITNDLFSQALQHALQASGQPSLQVSVSPFLRSPWSPVSRWCRVEVVLQLPAVAGHEPGRGMTDTAEVLGGTGMDGWWFWGLCSLTLSFQELFAPSSVAGAG